MGYDVRFQLVDRRSIQEVLQALARDTAPPASAFDRREDASALWDRARAAWRSGDAALAARAACWIIVAWSAASLPAVALRNVALTHRPLRMPDAYAGLHLSGLGSPRWMFEVVLGLESPVVAALPTRLDEGAETGAFIDRAEKAGADLAHFIRSLPEADRGPLARLLAVLRAAERANLAVWEALDVGPVVPADPGARTSLQWPGLTRPALEAPLSEAEWAQLDGSWHRGTAGDLDDLVSLAQWVDPADRARVPRVQRALQQAFVPGSAGAPFVDDILPRALDWLEATLATPELLVESARAHQQLMRCFLNNPQRTALPPEVLRRVATAPMSADLSPEQLAVEVATMFEQHRRSTIAPEIARGLADRWHALFLAAPELARPSKISDYVLDDTTPCALLIQRLDGPPSLPLVRFVNGLFDKACDDSDPVSAFNTTVLERAEWLRALARGVRALGYEKEARVLDKSVSDAQQRALESLIPSASSSEEQAERTASLWHALFLAAPEEAFNPNLTEYIEIEDTRACAHLLRRLEGPPSLPLGRMVLGLFTLTRYHDAPDAPFTLEIGSRLPWLRALEAGLRALGHGPEADGIQRRLDKFEGKAGAPSEDLD
ncbi:MAG: hypothetical protein QM820_23965 [Minicystis sp.]